MGEPPILRHEDWAGLIAELGARDGLSYLREISPPTASAVLAAPAAIARWIAVREPRLRGRTELKLVVIGAETTDAPDQGRWYQLLPQLLDASGAVETTLVGAELDLSFGSAAAKYAPAVSAQCVRSGLAGYLARVALANFDLAVVFHPGLQKHRGWLADRSFAAIVSAGVPLIAASYEADEYEMDRWVLECHGYHASAEPLLNPFFLELGDGQTAVRWGRALWQIEAAPPAGFAIANDRLAALDTLTGMVMHSMSEVGSPSPGYGEQVELRAGNGTGMRLIHVFDNRFVDGARGTIIHLTADGQLRDVGSVPAAVLTRYPGTAARDIERAVWAADIKARYLLDTYPARATTAAAAPTAREMLAALRNKAAKLFGR